MIRSLHAIGAMGAATPPDPGLFQGCTDPNAARQVLSDTLLESRLSGFAVGLVVGLIAGFVGTAYLAARETGEA